MKFEPLAGKIASSCLNGVIILLISGLLGEASLRLYDRFNPVFIFYDDSYNRFRGRPFADDWDFKLNSRGFKDLEFGEKKDYRILGIGDSFAFGIVPYRFNYLTLLEDRLRETHPGVEVLNLGIPSIGPKDYLSLLVREGLPLRPDMVLLSFFIGNDFDKEQSRPWYSRSYVASLLYYVFLRGKVSHGQIIHGKRDYCDDCPTMDADAFLRVESRGSRIYLQKFGGVHDLLDQAMSNLLQIRDICRQQGSAFVVVLIPDEIQVNPVLEAEVRKNYYPDIPAKEWNLRGPNERIVERLKAAGIDYLDLFPAFAEQEKSQRLYKSRDTHWNMAGNRLASTLIREHIDHYVRTGPGSPKR